MKLSQYRKLYTETDILYLSHEDRKKLLSSWKLCFSRDITRSVQEQVHSIVGSIPSRERHIFNVCNRDIHKYNELMENKAVSEALSHWYDDSINSILKIPYITPTDFINLCKNKGFNQLMQVEAPNLENKIQLLGDKTIQFLRDYPYIFGLDIEEFGQAVYSIENQDGTTNYNHIIIPDHFNNSDIKMDTTLKTIGSCRMNEVHNYKILFGNQDAIFVSYRGRLIGHLKDSSKRQGEKSFFSYVNFGDILQRGGIYILKGGNKIDKDINLDSIVVNLLRQSDFSSQELDLGISRMVKKYAQMQESDR